MNRSRHFLLALALVFGACTAPVDKGGTIAQLRDRRIEIKEVHIEGGFEKAMESYQRFLQETHDSTLVPEAMRRLADLKVEKEYGHLTDADETAVRPEAAKPLPASEPPPIIAPSYREPASAQAGKDKSEPDAEFEKRATVSAPVAGAAEAEGSISGADDLERAGALEAVALYQKLLNEYPLYERNDQVLYQMSRAYEELGRIEEAMGVMDRLVREYPNSRYLDEIQFRRAEYFFTHRHYLDAEDAYKSIVDIGVGSFYFPLALYKLGWTFYKQELYGEALDNFIALLDYKVAQGYDFNQTEDETEMKRMEDTFRVISLSFSSIGGADAVVGYFSNYGTRNYEYLIYSNLAEYYYAKRRYSDATATYNAFVSRNPFHIKSPNFHMRVIEINIAGGFPTLVIESKKSFATNYGLKAAYWQHFEPEARPEVLGFLKTNLEDLATHYHALYQDKKRAEEKSTNFTEARHWYREYLSSFPQDEKSPAINYQLAALFLENRSFAEAAMEYEKTSYDYPRHEKSSDAGFAAVYAYRQYLDTAPAEDKDRIKREVVRSSLKFADTYPEHEKAAIILGSAADDLDVMKEYEQARAAAYKLIEKFPDADTLIRRGAWLVAAHSSFELQLYGEAEAGYEKVLDLLPEDDKSRSDLVDNLAVSIYKQGEQAKAGEDYRAAANHFLRVGVKAPTSKYRPNAEYDAAAALIMLKDWKNAAAVLSGFRDRFPGHELQPEVTKKIAYVYKEDGQLSLAANEYERIEKESRDEEIRREALLIAAGLYGDVGDNARALVVFRRYVGYFPHPVEPNLETRSKISEILKTQNAQTDYLAELRQIVAIDAAAGKERTPRTRYLAGKSALVLAEQSFDQFSAVKLVKPFEVNLRKKKELMKTTTKEFNKLLDYEVGEVTAAATYYLAEILAQFSKDLMESERPEGLSPLEMEQYELAIEDQAYPFEEKAISVHESNIQLMYRGIYNEWIDKSLQKLAKFVPARYDKPEEQSVILASPDTNIFAFGQPRAAAPPDPEATSVEPTQTGDAAQTTETPVDAEPPQAEGPPRNAQALETVEKPVQVDEPAQVTKTVGAAESPRTEVPPQREETLKVEEPAQTENPARSEGASEIGEKPAQVDGSAQDTKASEASGPNQSEEPLRNAETITAGEAAPAEKQVQSTVAVETGGPANADRSPGDAEPSNANGEASKTTSEAIEGEANDLLDNEHDAPPDAEGQ